MIDKILREIFDRSVNLAGDSPGFSAKYLTYFVQDINSSFVVHAEIMDKRMTKGNSPAT